MSVRDRLRAAAGDELVERLEHLDAVRGTRSARPAPPPSPAAGDAVDVDVAIAGGGLSILLAPILAARGLSVVVLERARAAASHREWNASLPELQALERVGIADAKAIESWIVARYDRGICRFGAGGAYPVRGVLDCAVDARSLLEHTRALAEARGVRFLDGHTVLAHGASRHGVRLRVESGGHERTLTARVLVDARGAASPFATADLVCPTVGGVVGGLAIGDAPDEIDPRVGEILATVDGVEDGRQHVWEAFPGASGETTVYLFYYARAGEPTSLLELYARFFAELGDYKRGAAHLVRPTFGFIPGWSRLAPAPASDHPRVVLVGDAAARHSPLTYCGFGATLRSLASAADGVVDRVEGRSAPDVVVHDAPIHALTGALAHLMASRAFEGEELNELLDAAFATLHDLGEDAYGRLLRDEMEPRAFVDFLRRTARAHPKVWGEVMRGLGPWTAGRWGLGVAKQLLSAPHGGGARARAVR